MTRTPTWRHSHVVAHRTARLLKIRANVLAATGLRSPLRGLRLFLGVAGCGSPHLKFEHHVHEGAVELLVRQVYIPTPSADEVQPSRLN